MSRTVLSLKRPPGLRVDLRSVTPAALAALSVAEVEGMTVGCGNRMLPLAEWFSVARSDAAAASVPTGNGDSVHELRFEGDLSRFDRIGWQMAAGSIVVDGAAGDYVGGLMSGGSVLVRGDAGDLAACEMAGGALTVEGNVGDFAAATLPGSMDGMRGGTFTVRGNAGERFGDRMRRGTAVVFGYAGGFLASRMVAGTIALGGNAGPHLGYGMRRGSLILAGALAGAGANTPPPESLVGPTFVPLITDAAVFWQLLARDLAQHGGVFAELPSRRIERWAGDVSAGGKGELIFVS